MKNSFPSKELLQWFTQNQRPLPWRKKYVPYEVWLSEVMAQQTRIEQMLPYYVRFLKQFPNVSALADANEESVLKAWEGLGYYSRARNLQHAAREIKEKFGGKIPEKKEILQSLKGFGPYISSAVASIAFNENVCVVDGNVLRVATRFWGLADDGTLPKTRDKIEAMLTEVLPHGKARAFNQAMMEVGALVCVPENPKCSECPLNQECVARAQNKQAFYPVKSKKRKIPIKHFVMIILRDGERVALEQRTSKLLFGMWEFPMVEINPLKDFKPEIEKKLNHELNASIRLGKNKGELVHTYSHFTQHVHVFDATLEKEHSDAKFFLREEVQKKPLSKIMLKALALLEKK
jgi:A/G-specific adenine glycosylase